MVGSRKAKNIKKGENQMEDFTKIELTIKSRGGGALYRPTNPKLQKGGCCQPRIASLKSAKGGVML